MKRERVISPCFFIHFDTCYKLERLQRKIGVPKSVIIDIAIGLTNEKEIQNAVVSRSEGNGFAGKQEICKEQRLF